MGIGVNGIVGSGVYLLVAPLARAGRGSSVFGVLCCGVLCVLIALCFAELSSMYDRSGGPYVYARDAFGKGVGFAVGWLGMATGVLGLAAVSVGFAGALARFVPGAAHARAPIGVAIIVALGAINWVGVKQGARTSTTLSIVKIAPLVLVALAGLRFAAQAPLAFDPRDAARAAFLSIFMMSGFEFAAVPAGEVRDAKRTVPLAVVGSIAGASAHIRSCTTIFRAWTTTSCGEASPPAMSSTTRPPRSPSSRSPRSRPWRCSACATRRGRSSRSSRAGSWARRSSRCS